MLSNLELKHTEIKRKSKTEQAELTLKISSKPKKPISNLLC